MVASSSANASTKTGGTGVPRRSALVLPASTTNVVICNAEAESARRQPEGGEVDFEIKESIEIERPLEEVRAQFGDVDHHARTGVHRGVTFEILDHSGAIIRYRQTTRLGPIRMVQIMRTGSTRARRQS